MPLHMWRTINDIRELPTAIILSDHYKDGAHVIVQAKVLDTEKVRINLAILEPDHKERTHQWVLERGGWQLQNPST